MFKKILTDWALWILIIFNLYALYEYEQNPGEFTTLIFLYWAQSVLIGIANFFDLATAPKIKSNDLAINGSPVENTASAQGCTAIFFLLHYGGFHLGYLIFLIITAVNQNGHFDFSMFKIGVAIILMSVILDVIRKRMQDRQTGINISATFFTPYARIIPMHLMLIIPQFIKVKDAIVFIVLKILMDLVMHIVTSGYYKKPAAPLPSVAE